MLAIEAKGLSKRFGSSPQFALRELDLVVEEGEVFGLLGPNGAGKTTTLHLLLDFIHPSAGGALLFGHPASDPRTRARVGYLPESLSLHTYYRGADLLEFYGALLEMPPAVRAERAATLLGRLGLESVATRRVSTYSKGTLQRLGFAQALLNDPDLLILDEPTSSLATPCSCVRRSPACSPGSRRRRGSAGSAHSTPFSRATSRSTCRR